jgi:hypothetical protein
MRAFWNGIAVIAVAVLVGIGIAMILEHPPHAEPAAARVTTGLYDTALEVHHAIGEIENDAYQQHLAALAAALEQERLAAARRTGTPRAAAPRDLGPECAALSAQLGLPAEIIYRESRCSWSAFNHTGCGGRGCQGPAQIDLGHFAETSPWNSRASGACAGLNPDIESDYVECTNRLSGGGTNLVPWR